jgi:hypothetical protein
MSVHRRQAAGGVEPAVCVFDIDDSDLVFLSVGDVDCAVGEWPHFGREKWFILIGFVGIIGTGVRRRLAELGICQSVPVLRGPGESCGAQCGGR